VAFSEQFTRDGQPRSDFPCVSYEQSCGACDQYHCSCSRPPSLIDALKQFTTVPPRWQFDSILYNGTWDIACRYGRPQVMFSCDNLPYLCFGAVLEEGDEDSGPVIMTPGGWVVYA